MEKRLYKSSTNKILAGVCGGLGEYFDIDPVLVRVVWVISAFFGGAGILAYIIAAIVIPSRPERYGGRVYEATYRTASGTTTRKESAPEGAEGEGEASPEGQEAAEDYQGAAEGERAEGAEAQYVHRSSDSNGRVLGGIILIVLGGIFLMHELMPWIDGGLMVAACFIALGVYFLVRNRGDQQ